MPIEVSPADDGSTCIRIDKLVDMIDCSGSNVLLFFIRNIFLLRHASLDTNDPDLKEVCSVSTAECDTDLLDRLSDFSSWEL